MMHITMHTNTNVDEDFEVTAEMLIHDDVDDESTLDEEEAQQEEQDDQEIADLQKVCVFTVYVHFQDQLQTVKLPSTICVSVYTLFTLVHVCLMILTISNLV